MIETGVKKERAVLVAVQSRKQSDEQTKEYLDELAFLVKTAGGVVVERFVQKLDMPDPRSFVGIGKLNELKTYIIDNKIDMVVFDDELSASQIRNIEKAFKCKVMDRSNLILDIFAKRARTAHAKTQVELAQYEYLLPRLTRMWTHLERQRGGIGMRGPGEREIETDRRIIRDRIALLKKKLEQFDKQKSLQRKNRQSLVRVALVGYTNVGKSTIMNLLSKSEVFAENKLFATLDTTVRKVVIGNLPFLISDTVGFIRKLPHGLIESFKSTLDETTEADIILHVVDISHPNFEEQIEVVNQTLAEINANDKPVITVFNKVDRYEPSNEDQEEDQDGLSDDFAGLDLENTWMAKKNQPAIFISAKEKYNIDLLREKLYHIVKEIHVKRYPYNNFLY